MSWTESDTDAVLDRLAAPTGNPLPLPRAMLVFAHPDDETLAAGARLERFACSRFLCITDGAPRDGIDARAHAFPNGEAYTAARRGELEAVLRDAGIDPRQAAFLRCGAADEMVADQEAACRLVDLTLALKREIEQFAPEAVLTHPYEGGHPDHDSCAFAVHTAVRLTGGPKPVLCEAPFYHAKPGGMVSGEFLPWLVQIPMRLRVLSYEEARRKQARFDCFRTQAELLKNFATTHEAFRIAPAYEFTDPPHEGELLYERWGWPIDGRRFRVQATAALRALALA